MLRATSADTCLRMLASGAVGELEAGIDRGRRSPECRHVRSRFLRPGIVAGLRGTTMPVPV
jgi:hypothetical protein